MGNYYPEKLSCQYMFQERLKNVQFKILILRFDQRFYYYLRLIVNW